VDDEKLDPVRALLGTPTLKATVDGAFDEVLALDQRRRALLAPPEVAAPLFASLEGVGPLSDPAAHA